MAGKQPKRRDWPGFGTALIKILNRGYPSSDEGEDEEAADPPQLTPAEYEKLFTPAEYKKLLDAEIEYDPEAVELMDDPAARVACRDWLQQFANAWLVARCDVRKWEFKSELEAQLSSRTASLLAGRPPTVYLETPSSTDPIQNGHGVAAWLFFKFITSPLFDRLGRCTKCKNFYLAQRKQGKQGNRKYCSAKCGSNVTAKQTMEKKRDADYAAKIQVCKQALAELHALSAWRQKNVILPNWKAAVAKWVGSEITMHFVTRAVNRGTLTVPAWLKALLQKSE